MPIPQAEADAASVTIATSDLTPRAAVSADAWLNTARCIAMAIRALTPTPVGNSLEQERRHREPRFGPDPANERDPSPDEVKRKADAILKGIDRKDWGG